MLHFDLDTPLIEIQGKSQNDIWTIRHAVEGVQIFGGIGSGKSSGSGRFLALKYLRAGFGGLVLTVKPDEREEWIKYCRLANRIHDLVVISSSNDNFFNFLDYETERNSGGQLTENLVDVLKTVIRAGSEKSHGKSEDPFWENALDMLLFNVIDLCQLAYGKISVRRMYDIVQSIPRLQEDSSRAANKDNTRAYEKAFNKVDVLVRSKLEKWETQNATRLRGIDDRDIYDDIASADVPEYRQMKYLKQFFEDTYIPLSEKTRSIVEFSFSGFLFRLLRDPVYKLFCSNPSTVRPEDCLNGKIILLDLPVKLYDKVGRDAQIMFKYIWQRAMERRDPSNGTRPVFLWADEAQNFLHEHDADYQATARSSRICTVYITQNLPNYYGNMGGQKGEFKVKSFLGTLNTKIFHANSDIETNNYASSLFGDHLMEKISKGSSIGLGNISKSSSTSAEYERAIRPERFISLKTGSPRNQNVVEGFIQRQGEHSQMDPISSRCNSRKAIPHKPNPPTMKKNLYFQTFYKRSNPAATLAVKVFQVIATYPRLILEVFIRKNFGERYFTFGKALNAAMIMAIIPPIHYYIFQASTLFQYMSIQTQVMAMFGVGYATWYVFIIVFLFVAYRRKREITRNASVFDFKKFSLYNGDIHRKFYSIKLFGPPPDTRRIETLYEPAFFFLIGLVLYLGAQMVGLLLIVCAFLYRLSYIGAYRLGDDFVMDKIDEMISNEQLFDSFIDDKDAEETKGFRFYGRKPESGEFRRTLVESFIEDDEETFVAR